ncbi:MAG: hypothetical protein C5B50_04470 [Verrucomicrobia bacterium]|nr:MAG: hypothetical protein C5B50_04470 [Verrucomicrobiota bacterium]
MEASWKTTNSSFPPLDSLAGASGLLFLDVTTLPHGDELVSIIGVDYTRLKTSDGGDLYLTQFGVPFRDQLTPENWYAPEWFEARRVRLAGTSAIYRVPTRAVRGSSLDLVVRFSRVGHEVPRDPRDPNENIWAEFNSPFEEFALLMALRSTRAGNPHRFILTKKPLAIYSPARLLQEWQTGRSASRIELKRLQHPEANIDMRHQYILLYGWIKGLNAVQAAQALTMTYSSAVQFQNDATARAIRDLAQHGFRMADIKPEHIVLRIRPDGSLLRWPDGSLIYALVDYELLERIPEPVSGS